MGTPPSLRATKIFFAPCLLHFYDHKDVPENFRDGVNSILCEEVDIPIRLVQCYGLKYY